MAKQDQWARITLRLPVDLHERLVANVSNQPHSLNADIVARLKKSVEMEGRDVDMKPSDLHEQDDEESNIIRHNDQYFAGLGDPEKITILYDSVNRLYDVLYSIKHRTS